MLLSGAGVFMKRRAATWARPYGSTRVHLNPGRAGHGPAPTADTETIPFFRRGRSQTGPYSGRPQGSPLQFERTAFITGTVPLIRPSLRTGAPYPRGRLAGGASPSPTVLQRQFLIG